MAAAKERPRVVAEAIHAGDTNLLRALGRAGGIAAKAARQRRAVRRDIEESAATHKLAEELVALRESTNEHILDADGNPVGED